MRVNVTLRRSAGIALACLVTAGGFAAQASPRTAHTHTREPAPCPVPGFGKTIDQLWRPDLRRAINYIHTRRGDIAFAVRTDHAFYGYRADHVELSASVVKAMLLVTYLDLPWVRHRSLHGWERATLGPMIRASNNDDAQQIFDTVGRWRLHALAVHVGMTHFATDPVWGATKITARDQTRFFLDVDGYVARKHRSYAMRLLRSIVPWERWGIGKVVPRGWKAYFKGGWGYGTGLLDHQVALLVRGCSRVSIAVLTMYDGSHPYGRATLRGIFTRLLVGFPRFPPG